MLLRGGSPLVRIEPTVGPTTGSVWGASFIVIIDGSHKSWAVVTLALLLLSTGGYVVYARNAVGGPRGGSVPGMLYGIAGSGLMLYAGLISARKKVPRWRIGTAQTWLRGHLWLGLLSVPLILFHAGFHWGGLLEQVLLLVMAAIVVSGLVGLAVQQFLPGQMTARVPRGTFYAQIPHECRLLQLEGDVAVADVSSPLEMSPDLEVATPERLKRLGVKEVKDAAKKGKRMEAEPSPADRERQKHQRLLASVYRPSETHSGNGEASPPPRAKPSAAEMLAAARAKKAAQQAAGTPAEASQPTQPGEGQPAPSAASSSGTDSPAPAKQAKPSAAEMLAAARARKAAQQAAGGATAADASEQAAAIPAEALPTPNSTPETPASPKKAKPSAAEMLAAARAKKAAQQPATAAGEPQAAAAPAQSMPQAAVNHAVAPPTVERQTVSPAVREYCLKQLRAFYVDTVRPFLGEHSHTAGPLGDDVTAGGFFAAKKPVWPDDLGAVVERLADLCETRRQIAVQERMHRWLHGWLFVHVPLSLCLLGLGILHAVLSLYY